MDTNYSDFTTPMYSVVKVFSRFKKTGGRPSSEYLAFSISNFFVEHIIYTIVLLYVVSSSNLFVGEDLYSVRNNCFLSCHKCIHLSIYLYEWRDYHHI